MTEKNNFYEHDFLKANEKNFRQEKVNPPGRAITKNTGKTTKDTSVSQLGENKCTLASTLPKAAIKLTRSNRSKYSVKGIVDMLKNRTDEIIQKAASKVDNQILEEPSNTTK